MRCPPAYVTMAVQAKLLRAPEVIDDESDEVAADPMSSINHLAMLPTSFRGGIQPMPKEYRKMLDWAEEARKKMNGRHDA